MNKVKFKNGKINFNKKYVCVVYASKYAIVYNNICFNIWFYMININNVDKSNAESIVYDH